MTNGSAPVNTDALSVGDRLIVTIGDRDIEMTVWAISPAGSAGTRYSDGPHIHAHIRPGGYAITFDRGSHHYPNVRLA